MVGACKERSGSPNDGPAGPSPGTPANQPQSAPATQGGVIDGNGGELITTEKNPWFIGTAPVSYCINASDAFSLAPTRASALIQEAFATWANLLTTLPAFGSDPSKYQLPADKLPLTLARVFKETTCDQNPPLEFKLGIVDDSVTTTLAYMAARTVGFALRQSYDVTTGTGGGYIWLAPDTGPNAYQGPQSAPKFWSLEETFYNVVLHEVGHVLGFPHMDNTFMDAQFPAAVVANHLASKWAGADLLAMAPFPSNVCGTVLGSDGAFLNAVVGIASPAGVKLCTVYAPGLPGEGNTYALQLNFTLPDKSAKSALVNVSLIQGNDTDVTGQYLQAAPSAGTALTQPGLVGFNFLEVEEQSYFKGVLNINGATYPVLVERTKPGPLAFRVPYQGAWSLWVLDVDNQGTNLAAMWAAIDPSGQ